MLITEGRTWEDLLLLHQTSPLTQNDLLIQGWWVAQSLAWALLIRNLFMLQQGPTVESDRAQMCPDENDRALIKWHNQSFNWTWNPTETSSASGHPTGIGSCPFHAISNSHTSSLTSVEYQRLYPCSQKYYYPGQSTSRTQCLQRSGSRDRSPINVLLKNCYDLSGCRAGLESPAGLTTLRWSTMTSAFCLFLPIHVTYRNKPFIFVTQMSVVHFMLQPMRLGFLLFHFLLVETERQTFFLRGLEGELKSSPSSPTVGSCFGFYFWVVYFLRALYLQQTWSWKWSNFKRCVPP